MADYAGSYNGFSFGPGTNAALIKAQGVEDLPDVRSNDRPRSRDVGEFAGVDYPNGRSVVLDLLILDAAPPNDYFTTVQAFETATVTQSNVTTLPLTFGVPGRSNRILYCRPRRRSLPIDTTYQYRYGQCSVELHAVDPRWYDATQQSSTVGLPSASGGLTFPVTFPITFGSVSTGGQINASNGGNFNAPWTATINGPVTNPVITNQTTGQSLTFIITLNSGDQLKLDRLAKSVLLGGTASRYNTLQTGSQWFDLVPGTNNVRFTAASGTGTLAFAWRSVWL